MQLIGIFHGALVRLMVRLQLLGGPWPLPACCSLGLDASDQKKGVQSVEFYNRLNVYVLTFIFFFFDPYVSGRSAAPLPFHSQASRGAADRLLLRLIKAVSFGKLPAKNPENLKSVYAFTG